jgi:hypothetical protein
MIQGWSSAAFHRPLQQDINRLRVQLRQRFLPLADEELSGLSAQMTIREIKLLLSSRLHISPRQRLELRHFGTELADSWSLREAKLSDSSRIELTVVARTPEECQELLRAHPPVALRIRPTIGSGTDMLTLGGLRADTTIRDLKMMVYEQRLIEDVHKAAIEKARIMFSPAFLTWEVLLSQATLDDNLTIVETKLMRDDILLLANEAQPPSLERGTDKPQKGKGSKQGKPKSGAKKKSKNS